MTTTANQPKELWEAVLGELQMHVTRPSFETWLKNTVGIAFRDGEFVVGTPNAFVAEMLEQRMYSLISQTAERVVKAPVEVRFQVLISEDGEADYEPGDSVGQSAAESEPMGVPQPGFNPKARLTTLNTRYTFERYVVGKSNELAHAAAEAVSKRPGEVYNPLVLYSAVGLGKTHLMHAIGHRAVANGLALIYATTEEFTNEYIKAIREGQSEEFRDRYRSADVLLLDDIQFLIGKEQTQEGFFHTFNALHMTNRQIVITSDRPVSALTLLEDRIQSRLAGGLVVDIQAPDIETRLAILRAKAETIKKDVPQAVIDFLAERVHKNIRELEGSLNRVVAYADLTGSPMDVELVKRAIDGLADPDEQRDVPDYLVVDTVATYFGVDQQALKGRKRDKKTAQARQVAMYLMREEANMGLTAIGRVLGGKDHTTVAHGCDRIATQLPVDAQLRRDLLKIREALAAA
ncbi:MAG: chromosomal replication initiator protein DnaA [SAR202 cluster bacterium]|nr:chromosomal replication initiator protein DnaA [SAR202 cluster bacterium]